MAAGIGCIPDSGKPEMSGAHSAAAAQRKLRQAGHKLPLPEHGDIPEAVWPSELPELASRLPGRIQAVTLDCFDTILWRNVDSPIDVFYDLAQRPGMKRHGLTAGMRIKAEQAARAQRRFRDGSTEVTLRDIYRAALPDASTEDIDALMEEEIHAESNACIAFPGTLDFIRHAVSSGLKVHVVSDTYLTSPQLRDLLRRCLPPEVEGMLDHIFCSSEGGLSKSQGLFGRVLSKLAVAPATIGHVGDNLAADFTAPRALGISGIHLRQYDQSIDEINRLTGVVGGIALPEVRNRYGFPKPYRGVLGHLAGQARDPAADLGALALGPVMHAFAHYLHEELETLRAGGESVKMAFLMRDGHLPELAFATWHEAQGLAVPEAPRLSISRFVAYGASFRSKDDIDAYLSLFITSRQFEDFAHQLLLPADMARTIVAEARAARNPEAEFLRLIHRPGTLKAILSASAALRARLIAYLQRTLGLQRGDTLVFVDLGYEGTAQRLLAPVLRDELGIRLIARYLIASPTPGWQDQRAGLIDANWCDERASMALVRYIALLEDLCATEGASVVDYTEGGEPVPGGKPTPASQVRAIAPVQAAALDFVRTACMHFASTGEQVGTEALARHSLLALTRLLHAPTTTELEYLAGFQLDLGLGSNIELPLFDVDAGQRGLKERGMYYMERSLTGMRTNIPHELRAAGLELSLVNFAQNRFALDIYAADWRLQQETIQVIVQRGDNFTRHSLQANATFEGWFALNVPAGQNDMTVALALGASYRSLQIESVSRIPLARLHAESGEQAEDASARVELDGMTLLDGGLALCEREDALLVIHPDPRARPCQSVYRIVFRPLARR